METKRVRGFEPLSEEGLKKVPNVIELMKNKGFNKVYVNEEYKEPKRATYESAGSDVFYTGKEPITLAPNEKAVIILNIKAYMQHLEMLLGDVKSSQGMFKDLMLCNTIGVVDKDYYNNKSNEGNISVALRNIGSNPVTINNGDAVGQFIFVPYLAPDNAPEEAERNGGYGSTNK